MSVDVVNFVLETVGEDAAVVTYLRIQITIKLSIFTG